MSQVLWPLPAHASPELSRRALRSESTKEGAILKKLRAGLEEESYYQALLNKAKPGIEPVPGSNIKRTSGDFQTKDGLVRLSYQNPRDRVGGLRIGVYDPNTEKILFAAHERAQSYRSKTSHTGWSKARVLELRIGGIILGPGVEYWLIGRKDKDLKTPVIQGIAYDADSKTLTLILDPQVEVIEGSKRWKFSLEELTLRLVKGKGAAGLEEMSEEDELDLIGKLRNDWQFKLKVKSHVDTKALEIAIGGLPSDVTLFHQLLNLLRKFGRDVYLMEDKDLKGHGALLGKEALWLGEDAAREAGISLLIQAFETGNFDLIPGTIQPETEPSLLRPVPPASPPEEIPTAAPTPSTAASSPTSVFPKPVPLISKREPPPTKVPRLPAIPLKEMSFSKVLDAILDPDQQEGRNDREWSRLVARLVEIYRQDQKLTLTRRSTEQTVRLAAWRAFQEVSGLFISLEELLQKALGEIVTVQVGGATTAKFRDRLNHPRRIAHWMAIVAAKVWESYREDQEIGAPAGLLPLDGTLDPAKYLRRFRANMIVDSRRENYVNIPAYRVGFLDSVDKQDLGEPTPFGILSVLAARQFGQGATLRSFPELANALLENGVEDIRLLPSEPGAPPALLIQLMKPLADPYGQAGTKVLAVVLLKDPWPELPSEPEKPWAEMSDPELFETAVHSMREELSAVEFEEAKVRALSFLPGDSPVDQAGKVIALARLGGEGRLVARSRHLLYPTNPRVDRIARWLTRTPRHEAAARRYIQLGLEIEKQRVGERQRFSIPGPGDLDKFRERVLDRENAGVILADLSFPGLAQNIEAVRRAESVAHRLGPEKKKSFSIQDWGLYHPLLSLLFMKDAQGEWVIREDDVAALLNRLGHYRSTLLDDASVSRIHQLADSFGENKAAFLAELNHAVLRGDLLVRPFRSVPMEQAQEALAECCSRIFGPGSGRSPTAWMLQRAKQQAILEGIRPPKEMEELADQLQQIGSLAAVMPEIKLLGLSLKNPAGFEKGLEALRRQVAEILNVVQAAAADPARLELFRALLELRRQVAADRVQTALEQSAALLPQLQGPEELQRMRQFQEGLTRRKEEEKRRQAEAAAREKAIQEQAAREAEVQEAAAREETTRREAERLRQEERDREELARRFAGEFILRIEVELDLDSSSPDVTPSRIEPILGRIQQEAAPVVSEFPTVAAGLKSEEGRLRKAVAEAGRKAQPIASEAQRRKAEDEALRKSESPLEIVTILLSPRFEGIRSSEKGIGKFLGQVKGTKGEETPSNIASIWKHAEHKKDSASGDAFLFYQGVIYLANPLPSPKDKGKDQAGLEETPRNPDRIFQEGHLQGIEKIVFDSKGRLLSASLDRKVRSRDMTGGKPQVILEAPFSYGINLLSMDPRGRFLALASSVENTIWLWDSETGQGKKLVDSILHTMITSLAFHPSGEILASGGSRGEIWLWDVKTGEPIKVLTGHMDWVTGLVFHPNRKMLVSASYDDTLCFWNLKGEELRKKFPAKVNGVWGLDISPDGKTLAYGGRDKSIRLWQMTAGKTVQLSKGPILKGHKDLVRDLAFSPDGKMLVSSAGSYDQTVRIWEAASGGLLEALSAGGWVRSLAFRPDGKILAAAVNATKAPILLWELDKPRSTAKLAGPKSAPSKEPSSPSVQYTPKRLVVRVRKRDVKLSLTEAKDILALIESRYPQASPETVAFVMKKHKLPLLRVLEAASLAALENVRLAVILKMKSALLTRGLAPNEMEAWKMVPRLVRLYQTKGPGEAPPLLLMDALGAVGSLDLLENILEKVIFPEPIHDREKASEHVYRRRLTRLVRLVKEGRLGEEPLSVETARQLLSFSGLEEVDAAKERVRELLMRLRGESSDFGQRVVVVGPILYRDRMPFLPTLVEETLGPVSEQIFFDPWTMERRIDRWVRQFYDRPQGLPTDALYLGEEGEFRSFRQFGQTVLLPRLPVRFPEGGIASDPALLILQWLDSIGLSMTEDQRQRLRSDLELIIQA